MAFAAGYGGAGGRVRPRNPYPTHRTPIYQEPVGSGAALGARASGVPGPGLVPPVFHMPGPIDTSTFGAQAAAEAQRQIDPILQMIAQRGQAQAAYTQQSIGALTNAYANRLSGLAEDASNAYAGSIKTSEAFGGAANKFLTGAGKSAQATEKGATGLKGISAGSDVSNLAGMGAGAGNAAQVIQEGMTMALKTAQSAAMKYVQALPGFAQKEGQMQITDAVAQVSAAMAQQLAETTAQAPALYHQLYNEMIDRAQQDRGFALDMAKLQYQIDSDTYDRQSAIVGPKAPTAQGRLAYWTSVAQKREENDPRGYQYRATAQGVGYVRGPDGKPLHTAKWTQDQVKVLLTNGYDPNTKTYSPEVRAKVKALTGIDPGSGVSEKAILAAAKNKVDQHKTQAGIDKADADRAEKAREADQASADRRAAIDQRKRAADQRAATAAAKAAKAGGAKPPTAAQISKMVDGWYSGKGTTTREVQTDDKGNVITDTNGAPVYKTVQGPTTGKLSYNDALKRLIALHVPAAEAADVLNTRYRHGEAGRTWFDASTRATLGRAGLTPHVHYTSAPGRIAYLDLAQYKYLKSHGLPVPDGKLMNGRYQLYDPSS